MTERILTRVRRNGAILFAVCAVLLLGVLVLYLIDQKFNFEKRNRLIEDARYDPQFRQASRVLSGLKGLSIEQDEEDIRLSFIELKPSGGVYYATPAESGEPIAVRMETVLETLDEPIAGVLRDVLEGDNLFVRAEFYPALDTKPRVTASEPLVAVVDLEKKRRANRFSNNLFTRDFENVVLFRMGDLGNLRLYYTSPPDAAWMPALVSRYRWYSLGVVVFCLTVVLALASAMFGRRSEPPEGRSEAVNHLSTAGGRC